MSEERFLAQIKARLRLVPARTWDDIFLVVAIFLIALASFGIGRLSVLYEVKEPLRIEYPEGQGAAVTSAAVDITAENGSYVASLSGSRYHLPWCSGAQNIKEENKIWFATKEEAEIAGYTPATNCPGI